MKIIEINALGNGAHNNQTINSVIPIPKGWAVIPDDMTIPDTFPFVNITVKDGVVTSMTAGTVPQPEPIPEPGPSQLDRVEAQSTYTAMMTGTLIEGVMTMKEKIKRWYKQGLWTAAMVQNAADKGILTAEEVSDILNAQKTHGV